MRERTVEVDAARTADGDDVLAPSELVQAAVRAAAKARKDVADVPVVAIAQEAGMSRSTLLRRLGGSRAALDTAVRATGIDIGGRPPVRVRAVDAAAALIGESGMGGATLEAVAARAGCSVFSLYDVFGGRDELMQAVFERHSHVHDIEEFFASPHGDLHEAVQGFYRTLAKALCREPRVAPAMYAEVFARPESHAVQRLVSYTGPRMFDALGRWLSTQISAGHIRDVPVPLLIQQLFGPILLHVFMRPAAESAVPVPLPDMDSVCDIFAANFVRAVGTEHCNDREGHQRGNNMSGDPDDLLEWKGEP